MFSFSFFGIITHSFYKMCSKHVLKESFRISLGFQKVLIRNMKVKARCLFESDVAAMEPLWVITKTAISTATKDHSDDLLTQGYLEDLNNSSLKNMNVLRDADDVLRDTKTVLRDTDNVLRNTNLR